MRDLQLRHTLQALAHEAAAELTAIVEGGREIPYEIAEPDDGLGFCRYEPLTAQFVRDSAGDIRGMKTFAAARQLLERAEVAGEYLQEGGVAPPADPTERATLATVYFLARIWDGCSEFELDTERIDAAIAEIEECSEPEAGEVEAIVPLVGFQMEASRVELDDAAIVRAETVEVPVEAHGQRSGAAWEPTFVIAARIELDEDGGMKGAGSRVAETFDRVISTLRLHKSGGVGLGPHGWVRVAGDRWRRISTGAGRPRGGGYRLGDDELGDLADLARTVALHSRRLVRLRRALGRFEAGLDRRGAVDALNDYLIALRYLLEGEGPAGAGLAMRAAALSADGDERAEVRATVEGALTLERALYSGEPNDGSPPPVEVATALEEVLRTILVGAISGELGSDLRAAADEALLADGLAAGEGDPAERGGTSEWELEAEGELGEAEEIRISAGAEVPDEVGLDEPVDVHAEDPEAPRGEEPAEQWTEAVIAVVEHEEPAVRAEADEEPVSGEESDEEPVDEVPGWLDDVADEGTRETMDFPARSQTLRDLSKPPLDREQVRARVEYLFPRTETNWTVGQDAPSRHRAAS